MLHSRDRRVADSIRQTLSDLFQKDIQDPRLPPIVTFTHVEVAKDLRTAKVFYSHLPDDDRSLTNMEALLRDSAGFIRSRIAKEVNLKFTPTLHFRYDPSSANYQRINTVLHRITDKKPDSAT